ncbi:DUF3237 domain-containing protein [Pelomonas cellulosilytica]|uniref:UPF0311 protein LXT13_27415 n=1 Tax=Pelomonas cellulosilytica TaxID=2906762 RepID=A0ABS8Y4F4_9BURK|nr:DUF3237 domain-containing protein [Pelomonas sp. P8]MCE4558119.1 DUF3237 domain-containing protein [Pelomonas sp. P8]
MLLKRSLALLLLALLPGAALQAADTAAPPSGPQAEFVFEEIVTLAPTVQVGRTSQGHRQYVPITGGEFKGPRIQGRVLPGGWDWQLVRPDGHIELDASYMIRADDGTIIHVRNRGTLFKQADGSYDVKTVADFDVPLGPHQWLGEGRFVGTLGPAPEGYEAAVRLRFFRLR